MEKVLIIYSNPADTEHIRLDKEHRALDTILSELNITTDIIVRKHATTFNDLCSMVAKDQFSVFHFSGHGTSTGICLESDSDDFGEFASAASIADLLSKSQTGLKVAIFMSCFSAESIPDLLACAPYLITVFGPLDDNTAISFVSAFYKQYLRDQSVARSCFFAQQVVRKQLNMVVSRRAKDGLLHQPLFEVFPGGNHIGDSFLVDLQEAEHDIANLGVSREQFLDSLTRKIRLHSKIFLSPRENVFLPVGPYVGIFSWQNSADRIFCHRILKMKDNIEQEASDVWACLAVVYNDDAGLRYRWQDHPSAINNERLLKNALISYKRTLNYIYTDSDFAKNATILSKYLPNQYQLTKSIISANLWKAEQKIDSALLSDAIFYLESVLSAIHDLLSALTDALTEKKNEVVKNPVT